MSNLSLAEFCAADPVAGLCEAPPPPPKIGASKSMVFAIDSLLKSSPYSLRRSSDGFVKTDRWFVAVDVVVLIGVEWLETVGPLRPNSPFVG